MMRAYAVVRTIAVIALCTTGTFAQAQTSPPAVDAFIASANALAKSADERIDLGRSTARLQSIRIMVTRKLVAAKSGDTLRLDGVDERDLLCGARMGLIAIAAQRNYLQAVAAKIGDVGKASQIDNIIDAVKVLFASQSVDVTASIPDAAELEKLQRTMGDRCQKDLHDFDKDYYGQEIRPPAPPGAGPPPAAPLGLSFFGPIGSVISTIIDVITPVVVEGSKIIDEEKRRRVIREFLTKPENRDAIKNAGTSLAEEVSKFVLAKRHKLVGTYVESVAALRTTRVDLGKADACKDFLTEPKKLAQRPSGAPSDEFVMCWHAVWGQYESPVSAALKAADNYDQLADAGDSDNASKAFKPLGDALEGVANDQFNLAQLWAIATRLVAFADKVNTAASQENRDKIQKAIDALVKGG